MRRLLVLLLSVTLIGCGEDEAGSRSAEDAARAWVEAINAGDWERACELSAQHDAPDCEMTVRDGFRHVSGEMRIEGIRRSGDTTKFTVMPPAGFSPGEEVEGWTAYAPAEFSVERRDGRYLVHFEVAIVR